ncbi:hypothetical protein C8Q74DRAFT_1446128 [Fomes fomentarius]|nr:hypothetical protein C8Q74DRAFT_1446128 [Fomes fomentarius]
MPSTHSDREKEITINFLDWNSFPVPLDKILTEFKEEQEHVTRDQISILASADHDPWFPDGFTEDEINICVPVPGNHYTGNRLVYQYWSAFCREKGTDHAVTIGCSLKSLSNMGELAYRVAYAIYCAYRAMGLDLDWLTKGKALRQLYRRWGTEAFEVVLEDRPVV